MPALHCLLDHIAACRPRKRGLGPAWGLVVDCTYKKRLAAFRTRHGDLDAAWEAVRHARRPRVHTFIATSPIHMQYKLKMTPDQVRDGVQRHAACSGCEHRMGWCGPRAGKHVQDSSNLLLVQGIACSP